jgi:hypothetical protein
LNIDSGCCYIEGLPAWSAQTTWKSLSRKTRRISNASRESAAVVSSLYAWLLQRSIFMIQSWEARNLFYVRAGVRNSTSFEMSVGGLNMTPADTLIFWVLMSYVGRRGLGGLASMLFITCFISVSTGNSSSANYTQVTTMIVIWLFWYYMTVGPMCYAIVGEVSSIYLRSKNVYLVRIGYYIAQILTNVINPYLLKTTTRDWKCKTGFFWGGGALIFLLRRFSVF